MPQQASGGAAAGSGRRRIVGADLVPAGVSFRVWAPDRRSVSVVLENGAEHRLSEAESGYFEEIVPGIAAGTRYRYRLGEDHTLYPDPASRFQPDGPHGPSEVVDPNVFAWTDSGWTGVQLHGQIVYELHLGTFTPDGSWQSAAGKLPFLKDIGISLIEIMPIAEFPGTFGWGYDGVNLFAPTRLYGTPDDVRRFVDAAHRLGIGVILDVVYNHLGPDGNYLSCFSKSYFSETHSTEWGEAINFDGQNSRPVRDFFTDNAAYWIDEFHFDGLRLDATQSIFDDSGDHILVDIGRAARSAAGARSIVLIAENEPQETRLVRPVSAGGYGLDALWNDDFHHSAAVALTGRAEAYYEDHAGSPQEFISSAKYGYLFQGEFYSHQGKGRGTPGLDLSPAAFVTFIQNHDQIANSDSGRRFHELSHPAQTRAMTALLLLLPGTPMLFQGQEFGASTPFHYFADHGPDLAKLVRAGRVEFMMQFPSMEADAALRAGLRDPGERETYERCKLDWSEVEHRQTVLDLHRDAIGLRRRLPALSAQQAGGLDGAVLSDRLFVLRYFGAVPAEDCLVLVNLGPDLVRRSIAEPLLAPPASRRWTVAWSSEDPRYGGHGTPELVSKEGWRLPAHATLVLTSETLAVAG